MKRGRRKERCDEEGKKKGEGGEAKKNEGVKKTEGANKEVGARDFKNQPINDYSDGSRWNLR